MSENNLNNPAAEVVSAEAGIEQVLSEPVAGVIDVNEPSDADNLLALRCVERIAELTERLDSLSF